jgi:dTMP kinase
LDNDECMNGKLITLEGADGSGKGTQFQLLIDYCKTHNISFETMDFPRYEGSFFGALAGRMLKGDFGSAQSTAAELAVLPFACDRWLLKNDLLNWLQEGKLVISNRYTASSAVYQAARLPIEKQHEFLTWVYKLEQEVIGLPKEDLVLFCHIPLSVAQTLVDHKESRAYLGDKKRDINEESEPIQQNAEALYNALSKQSHWRTIECMQGDVLRKPDEIHKDIVDELVRFGIF